jgi:hypothetical protein
MELELKFATRLKKMKTKYKKFVYKTNKIKNVSDDIERIMYKAR